MTTARLLLQDAFESIRVYAPGEILLAADLSRGYTVLNDMLDSWSNESLTTFATLEQSITLVPGKFQYTIGVGADIDDVRPIRLTHGYGTARILDQTGNRYDLRVIQRDEWNLIGNIQQVNANIPQYLWYDPQEPWGVLNFYPIPNIGYTALWDSWLQLSQFPTPDQEVSFPVGYELALKRNLALELVPYYPMAVVTPQLERTAAVSKANVKRTNFRPTVAHYDPELVSKSRSTYNIYRDTGT